MVRRVRKDGADEIPFAFKLIVGVTLLALVAIALLFTPAPYIPQ